VELPEVPELPELPAEPLVPAPVPDVPPLLELPLSMPLPLLPLLSMELHAESPKASASKPARSTLWCFCFMINSF
jgi:hypothetical protein